MLKYHLFLDESETHTNFSNMSFCIAGVIIEESDYNSIIKPAVRALKRQVWNSQPNPEDLIFHEKDIKFANNRSNRRFLNNVSPEYHIFQNNNVTRALYDGIEKIFNLKKMTVIGSCIDIDKLNSYFHKDLISDKYLIAMQILLENYCHFLQSHDGVGVIHYESRQEHHDKEVRMRINHIKAMGTMFVSPYAIQRRLQEICFPSKMDNVEGLQIADFVPNPFARKCAGKPNNRFNNYQAIKKCRYDGGLGNFERFGVKVLP